MPAYNVRTLERLRYGVNYLADNFHSHNRLILTPEEFIAGFIDPEHVPVLRAAQELVGGLGVSSQKIKISGTATTLWFQTNFTGASLLPMPQYVENGLTRHAPETLRNRITQWVDARVETGRMFGDAIDALDWLYQSAGNAAAAMLMFPAIPVLLMQGEDAVGYYAKVTQSMRETKNIGVMPKVAPEVRARLVQVSSFLLACTLVEYKHAGDIPEIIPAHTAVLHPSGIVNNTQLNLFLSEGYNSTQPVASFR
jgi:hypothetical protein